MTQYCSYGYCKDWLKLFNNVIFVWYCQCYLKLSSNTIKCACLNSYNSLFFKCWMTDFRNIHMRKVKISRGKSDQQHSNITFILQGVYQWNVSWGYVKSVSLYYIVARFWNVNLLIWNIERKFPFKICAIILSYNDCRKDIHVILILPNG